MSSGPPLEGLQPTTESSALIASVRHAIEEARLDEAKIIQSLHRGLNSWPVEEHAGLAENMAVKVCQVQERLLDRVRDTFLVALRESPELFSAETRAACKALVRCYLEESKSRCMDVCLRTGLQVEAAMAKNEIQFVYLMGAMNGIFDILRQVVELDITRQRWVRDDPRGDE